SLQRLHPQLCDKRVLPTRRNRHLYTDLRFSAPQSRYRQSPAHGATHINRRGKAGILHHPTAAVAHQRSIRKAAGKLEHTGPDWRFVRPKPPTRNTDPNTPHTKRRERRSRVRNPTVV